MRFASFFSRQARRPKGFFGRFCMSLVFDRGNVEMNALVFEALSVMGSDHLLEIGFGTGGVVRQISTLLEDGLVEGIDFSRSMVAIAEKKNRKQISSGNVRLHLGDFDQMVFEDQSFDKIFTVNTVYFWRDPGKTIARVCAALKPGGKFLVGFHGKRDMEKMTLDKGVFRYYSPEEMQNLLSVHGALKDIDIISSKGKSPTCYCAVGTK